MNDEKINVRLTESGDLVEVLVYSKRPERITVVLGTGAHSVTCEMTPTRTAQAYAPVCAAVRLL